MAAVPDLLHFLHKPVRHGLIPSLGIPRPHILWFGCSSSSVQEAPELGLMPGEIIEHRNLGNMLSNHDSSTTSSVEYALRVEKVNHIVVCGHYGCSFASIEPRRVDSIDPWLKNVRNLYKSQKVQLEKVEDLAERRRLFAELHTWYQVEDLLSREIVQDAVNDRGVKVYAFMYDNAKKECLQLTTD